MIRERELLVRLREPSTAGSLRSEEGFLATYDAALLDRIELGGPHTAGLLGDRPPELLQIELAEGQDPEKVARAMQADPRVAFVDVNRVYERADRWSLERIQAPQAWALVDGPPTLVAVLDTGLDVDHPALQGCLWTNPGEIAGDGLDNDGNGVADDVHGYDATRNTGDVRDTGQHGTHVSGIVAATTNGNVQLMPIRIFDRNGFSDAATLVRALNYATRMGARITNNSVGGAPDFDQSVYEAYRDCPALHVMSAGNQGSDNDAKPHYPSSFELPNIVAVAASTRKDTLGTTSGYGANSVDLAAPGEQIYSTAPGGRFIVRSGTSQAAPHVTGVAALIASAHPEADNDEIKRRLLEGAEPLPALEGKVKSEARLNAWRSLQ